MFHGYLFYGFTYAFGYVFILILSMAIASALYLIAELSEEYPSHTGTAIKYNIWFVMTVHILLLFDGLPWYEVSVGLISHLVYMLALRTFPFVQILSVSSFLCIICFSVDNITWLRYFVINHRDAEFIQVLGFFFCMVWIAPVSLIVCMCQSENILPSSTQGELSNLSTASSDGKKRSIPKMILDNIMTLLQPLTDATTNAVKAMSTKKAA